MEKLELKHIVGYLPYGLKVIDFSMHENGFRIEHSVKKLVLIPSNLEIGLKDVCGVNQKLILHPLSDLTKEIEVNGEKFVPRKELVKIFNEIDWSYINLDPFSVEIFLDSNSGINFELSFDEIIRIIQKLLEWHFDIYGLIEKGLAIDKNTLS